MGLVDSLGSATGLDAGTCRDEECPSGTNDGKNSSWVFGGVDAAVLRVERNRRRDEKYQAKKQEGSILHSFSYFGKLLAEDLKVNERRNSLI